MVPTHWNQDTPAEQAEGFIPFPNKQYQIILADPPWSYDDKASAGKRGASFKYNVMSLEDIKALPVGTLASDNCVLFMWITGPMFDVAFDVISSWGFSYKTVAFTWLKTTKHGKLFWGMGNWTRANAEYCLLAVRGKPQRVSAGVHSAIMSEIREHSRKPDETRERIVQLLGDVPRIELFARERVSGWDSWGDEI